MLIPRKKTPELKLNTLDGDGFDLDKVTNERGSLIHVYRGLHCPICISYLKELDSYVPQFAQNGVGVVAVTSDGEERARKMAGKVGGTNLRFAYDFPLAEAREWGLYLSTSKGKTSIGVMEPDLFPEPGIFLVQPDRTLYWATIQTMPFARPRIEDLLKALDRVIEVSYPARGEYAGPL